MGKNSDVQQTSFVTSFLFSGPDLQRDADDVKPAAYDEAVVRTGTVRAMSSSACVAEVEAIFCGSRE